MAMMSPKVEPLFSSLCSLLSAVLAPSELKEIEELIIVGEYGLALETCLDLFVEERKLATKEIVEIVAGLASEMELDAQTYLRRLPQ
jgi:hypothetical protein